MKQWRFHLLFALTFFASILSAAAPLMAVEKSHFLFDHNQLSVFSPTRAILKVHRKIWINDERNKAYGNVKIDSNEFIEVRSVKAWIKNEDGKKIDKLSKDRIRKASLSEGNVLYSGKGVTFFSMSHHTLPYFLEYQFEIEYRSLLFWPDWYPQRSIPVQRAIFELTIPKHLGYSTIVIGPIQEAEVGKNGETSVWTLTNIPASSRQYMSPPEDEVQYGVCFSPREFVLNNVRGTNDSWGDIGKWFHQISAEQYGLEPETEVGFDIADSLAEEEKIQEICSYVQNTTRYVAIQPGIHGWKPHKAQLVHNYKYGDCKDLTTYFLTLLKREGIHAYPAFLRTRDSGVISKDFPVLGFNHVIAFIPLVGETLWVDCTDDYTTIWDLPPHDEGCTALVIKDGIGRLIQTPVSNPLENQVVFTANAELRLNQDIELAGSLEATGNEAQMMRRIFRSVNDEKRHRIFMSWLGKHSPSIEMKELRFTNLDNEAATVRIEFRCIAKKYGNSSTTRFYFNPNFFSRISFAGETPATRRTAVFYSYPHTYVDRITYRLPDKFTPEALPSPTKLIHPFGEYEYLVEESDGNLLFSRKHRINQQRIELSEYEAYYGFMREIEKMDAAKVVFKKGN